MPDPTGDHDPTDELPLEELAGERPPGLLAEFWAFLRYNRKWWLLPIIIVLLIAAVVIVLVPVVAPFIYPL